MKSNLKKKQIVWARTKGHPWWPGIVTQVMQGNQYAINFIGDDSQQGSILASENLFDFQEKYDEFSEKGKKNKKLQEAIVKAQKIIIKTKQDSSNKKKQSDSEEDEKHKKGATTRKYSKKVDTYVQDNAPKVSPISSEIPPNQQKKQHLDREFQDLLLLLIAQQLNYDQIKQKLTPILETIEAQVISNQLITEVLSDKKGSILNAVYMILKHQSEQNPDHFFQRDIQQQITRLHDLISKLKYQLMNQFFNTQNLFQNLTQVYQNQKEEKILKQIMNEDIVKPLEKISSQPSQSQQQAIPLQSLQSIPSLKKQNKLEKLERKKFAHRSLEYLNEEKDQVKTKDNVINTIFPKKTQKKNEIPDQSLRRKVCFNMLPLILLTGIDETLAQKIVIKIESFGRDIDPQMRNKYGKVMWDSLVNLDNKLLKKDELISLLEDNQNQEVWNKLIQVNNRIKKLANI